jgi:hypothetical protein
MTSFLMSRGVGVLLTIAIVALTLATAYIHLSLGGPIFLLNGFGYLGLAALYGMLATGIGALVFAYGARYLPLHLEHEGRPASDAVRFYFFVLLFMGSMVGLATAQDLILLFVFWDLTAIASYYLIGFDRHKEESRASVLMALLVTGITAVLLLIGVLFLYAAHGAFSVPELAGHVHRASRPEQVGHGAPIDDGHRPLAARVAHPKAEPCSVRIAARMSRNDAHERDLAGATGQLARLDAGSAVARDGEVEEEDREDRRHRERDNEPRRTARAGHAESVPPPIGRESGLQARFGAYDSRAGVGRRSGIW